MRNVAGRRCAPGATAPYLDASVGTGAEAVEHEVLEKLAADATRAHDEQPCRGDAVDEGITEGSAESGGAIGSHWP